MKKLDIRDIAIIDSFPSIGFNNKVTTVGCGGGRIEHYLTHKHGCNVIATDIVDNTLFDKNLWLRFEVLDITKQYTDNFYETRDLRRPVVICAQVLEHLKLWKRALKNLINLATMRVIITVPYKASFSSPDHVNLWNDTTVKEYIKVAMPYSTAISKIRTKPEDAPKKGCFLIVIDKKQKYGI